jgi:hypothetical protein
MTSDAVPFQFDISAVLASLARRGDALPSAVQLNLPFLSVRVHPSATDVKLSRELLVKMRDRRVLDFKECCDGCIDQALTSLQQIRGILLDLQVKLTGEEDSALAPLLELMAVSIRQFLTFEQTLARKDNPAHGAMGGEGRPWDTRQAYFDALELLRGHLSRCLGQVAVIAGVDAPSDGLLANYRGPWPLTAYANPGALARSRRDPF